MEHLLNNTIVIASLREAISVTVQEIASGFALAMTERWHMRFSSPPNQQAYYEQVWQLVRQIPRGKVASYGQIALMIPPPAGVEFDSYKAFSPRWVGGAMAACPDDVPWQRVINSQGKISARARRGAAARAAGGRGGRICEG